MTATNRPTRIGDVLRAWLDDSGLRERMAQAHAVEEWADCVGPAIAAVTEPLRVSDGALIVAVRSSAWLSELRLFERRILEHINRGRAGRIRRIRFVMAATRRAQAEEGTGSNPRFPEG